jgi:hypothetical protein
MSYTNDFECGNDNKSPICLTCFAQKDNWLGHPQSESKECCCEKQECKEKECCRCEKQECKEKECCRCEKQEKKQNVTLVCGARPQDAIFEIDDDEVEDDQSFILDTLQVDVRCKDSALVKLEFSSLVFFEAEGEDGGESEITVDLLFELVRVCNNYEEVIQSWRYLKEFEITTIIKYQKIFLVCAINQFRA